MGTACIPPPKIFFGNFPSKAIFYPARQAFCYAGQRFYIGRSGEQVLPWPSVIIHSIFYFRNKIRSFLNLSFYASFFIWAKSKIENGRKVKWK